MMVRLFRHSLVTLLAVWLLGLNGMLLFGLTAAFLFSMSQRAGRSAAGSGTRSRRACNPSLALIAICCRNSCLRHQPGAGAARSPQELDVIRRVVR